MLFESLPLPNHPACVNRSNRGYGSADAANNAHGRASQSGQRPVREIVWV